MQLWHKAKSAVTLKKIFPPYSGQPTRAGGTTRCGKPSSTVAWKSLKSLWHRKVKDVLTKSAVAYEAKDLGEEEARDDVDRSIVMRRTAHASQGLVASTVVSGWSQGLVASTVVSGWSQGLVVSGVWWSLVVSGSGGLRGLVVSGGLRVWWSQGLVVSGGLRAWWPPRETQSNAGETHVCYGHSQIDAPMTTDARVRREGNDKPSNW